MRVEDSVGTPVIQDLRHVFVCLKEGGRAWYDKQEVKVKDNSLIILPHTFIPMTLETIKPTRWEIELPEPSLPEDGYEFCDRDDNGMCCGWSMDNGWSLWWRLACSDRLPHLTEHVAYRYCRVVKPDHTDIGEQVMADGNRGELLSVTYKSGFRPFYVVDTGVRVISTYECRRIIDE